MNKIPNRQAICDVLLEQAKEDKCMDELVRQLKLFYARSKLIILLTDREPTVNDEQTVKNNMQPFLRKKLIYAVKDENGCKIHKNLV